MLLYPKYIMLNGSIPIIFPSDINHADMAKRFDSHYEITSAGFIGVLCRDDKRHPKVYAYGSSQALGLNSNEKDTDIINRVMRTGKWDI